MFFIQTLIYLFQKVLFNCLWKDTLIKNTAVENTPQSQSDYFDVNLYPYPNKIVGIRNPGKLAKNAVSGPSGPDAAPQV